jgi:hypothetical protein
VPFIYSNRSKQALTANISKAYTSSSAIQATSPALYADRNGFNVSAVGGDSGNTACLVVNGLLVVANAYATVNSAAAEDFGDLIDELNAGLVSVGSDESLDVFDPSGFTDYS